MSDTGDDFQKRVADALKNGEPIPEFPEFSPLGGLAMAQHEVHSEFVKAGFARGEALYLTASMFCGNPSQSPANDGDIGPE